MGIFNTRLLFFPDTHELISKSGSTCALIQTTNTGTELNAENATKPNDSNTSHNPSVTNMYQEGSLCERDGSDSRQSSFEEYICYCNGSNTR